MTDTLTKDQRRRIMQANRGRTQVERLFASALWRRGLRYVTHDGYKSRYGQRLPGSPDVVFPPKRVAIFVDGCFWHGCPKCKGIPQRSGDFWRRKIERNIERDREVDAKLRNRGWLVIRVPEHAVNRPDGLEKTAERVARCVARRRGPVEHRAPAG